MCPITAVVLLEDLEKDALKCHASKKKNLDPVLVAAVLHGAGKEN